MDKREFDLMQMVQRIGVFQGLELQEVQRILACCRLQMYEADQRIYTAGGPSEDMIILLRGELVVSGEAGHDLGKIPPGTSTGEVGVFTGRPRSANVTASVDSTGLVIHKSDMDALLKDDWQLEAKVLRNLLGLLCDRLINANISLEDHVKEPQSESGDQVEPATGDPANEQETPGGNE